MIRIVRYRPQYERQWDEFIQKSRNCSFLHIRGYMDYHSHRFQDHSLMIMYNDKLTAVLPANAADGTLYSHQGLTYGGLVSGKKWNTRLAVDVIEAIVEALLNSGFKSLVYKPMPYIYGMDPSAEDLYGLFRVGAELSSREISTVVSIQNRKTYSRGKKSGLKQAGKYHLTVAESNDFPEFYRILTQQLLKDYNTAPVHSMEELLLLKERFPNNIRLFTVKQSGTVTAGTVIYETPVLAHAQYIASNETGRDTHSLDCLFDHLLTSVFEKKKFFDFGISTEQKGRYLNEGLIRFKEGFGAGSVCYDTYKVELCHEK